MSYQIDALLEEHLPSVVKFLESFDPSSLSPPSDTDFDVSINRITHRLCRNPARTDNAPLGYLLRKSDDNVVGTIFFYPWRFWLGDQPLLGLGTGGFFVSVEARMQGFLMFRRYLSLRDFDFWYATTCNASSGPLWVRSKGLHVEGSGIELIYVNRAGSLIEEFMLRKGFSSRSAQLAQSFGALSTPFVRKRLRKNGVTVKETNDLEMLAWISRKCRNPKFIESDRSVEYFQWMYKPSGPAASSPAIYQFDAGCGDTGWFSLGRPKRGVHKQMTTTLLLDWAAPAHFDLGRMISTAAEIARGWKVDLFTVSGRCDLSGSIDAGFMTTRTLKEPIAYVIGNKISSSELARSLVIAASDRF